MKKPVRIEYNPKFLDWGVFLEDGTAVTLHEMAAMYNRLVTKYNTIYDELAEYIPYAAPDMPVDTSPANPDAILHDKCPNYDAGINGCLTYACPDCDLNNPQYNRWKPNNGR